MVPQQQRFYGLCARPVSWGRLGGSEVWRISIATAIQITPCSTPLLAKQQSGIYREQRSSGALGAPTLPSGWALVATKDFNGNGKPDYVLYKAGTRASAIWYLNNNVFVSGAYGPPPGAGWSLVKP
jgi:hypothetical protein